MLEEHRYIEIIFTCIIRCIFIEIYLHVLRKHTVIGFTLLYFKMALMPLIPETKMVDVLYFDLRPGQNAIQSDAPGGSNTFQWQL